MHTFSIQICLFFKYNCENRFVCKCRDTYFRLLAQSETRCVTGSIAVYMKLEH